MAQPRRTSPRRSRSTAHASQTRRSQGARYAAPLIGLLALSGLAFALGQGAAYEAASVTAGQTQVARALSTLGQPPHIASQNITHVFAAEGETPTPTTAYTAGSASPFATVAITATHERPDGQASAPLTVGASGERHDPRDHGASSRGSPGGGERRSDDALQLHGHPTHTQQTKRSPDSVKASVHISLARDTRPVTKPASTGDAGHGGAGGHGKRGR